MKIASIPLLLLLCHLTLAQNHLKIREFRQKNEHTWLNEYIQFLSIPNIVKDTTNDIRKNALFISQMMQRRGIKAELLELNDKVPPVVFGEINVSGATQTVIFYAHYDGQPVQPSEKP